MSKIYPYLQSYLPPMPAISVSLAAVESTDWQGPFSAIVDTGSDGTIVPLRLIKALNLSMIQTVTLRSHWRDRHDAALYEVDLLIDQSVLPAIDVVGDPRSREILLGRNVLNRLDLRLNGFQLKTHILRI